MMLSQTLSFPGIWVGIITITTAVSWSFKKKQPWEKEKSVFPKGEKEVSLPVFLAKGC